MQGISGLMARWLWSQARTQVLANAALYLCSPAAGWVSGKILTVSGGGVQELN